MKAYKTRKVLISELDSANLELLNLYMRIKVRERVCGILLTNDIKAPH